MEKKRVKEKSGSHLPCTRPPQGHLVEGATATGLASVKSPPQASTSTSLCCHHRGKAFNLTTTSGRQSVSPSPHLVAICHRWISCKSKAHDTTNPVVAADPRPATSSHAAPDSHQPPHSRPHGQPLEDLPPSPRHRQSTTALIVSLLLVLRIAHPSPLQQQQSSPTTTAYVTSLALSTLPPTPLAIHKLALASHWPTAGKIQKLAR